MDEHTVTLGKSSSRTELGDRLTRHKDERDSAAGDVLPPGFVQAVLDDSRYTDLLMDALEATVVALEEVAAALGIRRLSVAWRLGRSLRDSVRHFPGSSFIDRRYEAASAEWDQPRWRPAHGSAQGFPDDRG